MMAHARTPSSKKVKLCAPQPGFPGFFSWKYQNPGILREEKESSSLIFWREMK
jgi:hypothetical protein